MVVGTSKMAQDGKAVADKTEDVSLIPGIHMAEGQTSSSCL